MSLRGDFDFGKAASSALPQPTGLLPHSPPPLSGLRCWEDSRNPWKPQRKLEIRREEGTELLLQILGRGRRGVCSLRSKCLKPHVCFPARLSTNALAPMSLKGCWGQGQEDSFFGRSWQGPG